MISTGATVIDTAFASRYGVGSATRMRVLRVVGDELDVEYTDAAGVTLTDRVYTDEVTVVTNA